MDGDFDPGRIALRGEGDVDVEFLRVVGWIRFVDQAGLVFLRVGGFVFSVSGKFRGCGDLRKVR